MPVRVRTTTHLVLATLVVLWLGAVAYNVRYRDITWLQYLFVDVTWIQAVLIIVGGYGAFLILVGALSRVQPTPPLPASLPFVSVIVPAKNEEAVIEATVRSLCALDYADQRGACYEVVVVDHRSTDRTPEILAALARELPLRVLPTPEGTFGKAGAMNVGVAQARGDILLILDSDARVAPDFLGRMVAHLDDERVGGVQGRRLFYNARQNLVTRMQDDEFRLIADRAQLGRQALGGMVCFSGSGMLLRRSVLEEVGGVNEDALIENVDLAVRFHLGGWAIRYAGDAVIWEEAVPGLRDLFRQRIRWLEGGIQCLGDYLLAVLFGRAPVFKRLDMLLFLGGALIVTLALLTTYLYAVIDLAGAVVLYLQLPRRIMTMASVAMTASVLLGALVEHRGRVIPTALMLLRLGTFSMHRLLALPVAIYRYLRSAITGETSWEKTAHGAARDARAWTLHPGAPPKDES